MLDDDYLVRYHSVKNLLKIHDLVPDIIIHKELFQDINDTSKKRKKAIKEF